MSYHHHLTNRPTAEEWQDPLRYISSIRERAEIYGICKIVPPEGWAPPLALDKNSLRFNTVIQAVHRLQDRLSMPAQQAFYEELRSVMSAEGRAPKKPPQFGGREVDLFRLYRAVAKRGGYAAVTEEKKWKDVVRVLQVRAFVCVLYLGMCAQCGGEGVCGALSRELKPTAAAWLVIHANNSGTGKALTTTHFLLLPLNCFLSLPPLRLMLSTLLPTNNTHPQLPSGSNSSYSMRQVYQKFLLPYEEFEQERMRREAAAMWGGSGAAAQLPAGGGALAGGCVDPSAAAAATGFTTPAAAPAPVLSAAEQLSEQKKAAKREAAAAKRAAAKKAAAKRDRSLEGDEEGGGEEGAGGAGGDGDEEELRPAKKKKKKVSGQRQRELLCLRECCARLVEEKSERGVLIVVACLVCLAACCSTLADSVTVVLHTSHCCFIFGSCVLFLHPAAHHLQTNKHTNKQTGKQACVRGAPAAAAGPLPSTSSSSSRRRSSSRPAPRRPPCAQEHRRPRV